MAHKSYRRHKRGGRAIYVSETQSGNPNLPYSQPLRGGRRHRRYRMKGGSGTYPYSSGSSYGSYVNGNENSQYSRTLSLDGPYANVPGNLIIGAQGQGANMIGTPNAGSLALIQSAGSRRRHRHRHRRMMHHTKKRRGGFLGEVINQAIVPFGILGMQQSYRRNKNRTSKNKSRRRYK